MAVTFTNNFKNILDKLESVIKTEFKGALPTCVGYDKMHGSQYLRIVPESSSLLTLMTDSEERQYNIKLIYYFDEKMINTKTIDHILRYTSRIEALIHDNVIMTLSDSTTALNCKIQSTQINAEQGDGIHTVEMEWQCSHVGNIG
tara:strand:- start:1625 stop:2059 length:435 start_codon:yes stop_codon:yes gene_type:complete